MNIANHVDDSPFVRKSTNMHPSVSLKADLITLPKKGTVLTFLLEILCNAMPCSVVLFMGQNGVTSSHHQS
jgi:hypothetical protein